MAETIFERRAQAQEHYKRGMKLKEDGFLLEAEQEFRHSLEDDPAYFEPLLELLVEQEETGVSEDIRTDKLLRRADQKYKLGLALLRNDRAEKAVRHLHAACQLENTNAKYHCGFAEALMAVGRREEALEILRYAAEINGGSNPWQYRAQANILLGEVHLQDRHFGRARQRLIRAYSLNPQNEEILPLLKRSRVGFFRRLFLLPKINRAKNRKSNVIHA